MQNVTNTWLTNENPNVPYLNLDVVLVIITTSILLSNFTDLWRQHFYLVNPYIHLDEINSRNNQDFLSTTARIQLTQNSSEISMFYFGGDCNTNSFVPSPWAKVNNTFVLHPLLIIVKKENSGGVSHSKTILLSDEIFLLVLLKWYGSLLVRLNPYDL